jgi:isopentenyldiphosphate isomerase
MDFIHAVIGVCRRRDGKVLYLHRTSTMEHYPSTWGLLSEQFDPKELPEPSDLKAAQRVFDRMTQKRFEHTTVAVTKFLYTAASDQNPMKRWVILHVYLVDITEEFVLNMKYYNGYAWWNQSEFDERANNKVNGLCTRSWKEHTVKHPEG